MTSNFNSKNSCDSLISLNMQAIETMFAPANSSDSICLYCDKDGTLDLTNPSRLSTTSSNVYRFICTGRTYQDYMNYSASKLFPVNGVIGAGGTTINNYATGENICYNTIPTERIKNFIIGMYEISTTMIIPTTNHTYFSDDITVYDSDTLKDFGCLWNDLRLNAIGEDGRGEILIPEWNTDDPDYEKFHYITEAQKRYYDQRGTSNYRFVDANTLYQQNTVEMTVTFPYAFNAEFVELGVKCGLLITPTMITEKDNYHMANYPMSLADIVNIEAGKGKMVDIAMEQAPLAIHCTVGDHWNDFTMHRKAMVSGHFAANVIPTGDDIEDQLRLVRLLAYKAHTSHYHLILLRKAEDLANTFIEDVTLNGKKALESYEASSQEDILKFACEFNPCDYTPSELEGWDVSYITIITSPIINYQSFSMI